jgi:chaperonin GroES
MKPLGYRVIVRRSELKKDPKKLIELPEGAKEKPLEGVVIEAGLKTSVQKGDLVLFGKYAGSEITVKGQDYLVLNEDEILVVL